MARLCLLSCLLLLAAAPLARAQPGDAGAPVSPAEPASPAEDEAPALVAPAPLQPIQPVNPVEPGGRSEPISVVLRLSIDAEGRVESSEVLQSGGAEYDAAVEQAARDTGFSPALRAGTPIAARIMFRYDFAPPEPAPTPEPEPAPTPVPPPAAAPQQVTVSGEKPPAERLQKSSDAVTVVRLDTARKRAADLGEVLARVPGVSVRRAGSLGAEFRLSMNGLYDDQIRTFVDGIPIELVYAQALADLSVNLLDRAEVYRGVVPIRLGSDALGGAINLVRPERYETMGSASYQIGSFGMHRGTLTGRYRHEPTGFVMGVEASVDSTDSDYRVDVELPGEFDQITTANVRRFHDAYRAYGVVAEIGVVDRPWARKLILQGFTSGFEKELQHNRVMAVPYGEAENAEYVYGSLLRYQHSPLEWLDLDAALSHSFRTIEFIDKSRWVYDWYGERVSRRRVRGEVEAQPHDQLTEQHSVFGRLTLAAKLAPGQRLTFNASPQYVTRTGDERFPLDPGAIDPMSGVQQQLMVVTGLEYRSQFLGMPSAPADPQQRRDDDYRIENTVFAKWYHYHAASEELNALDRWNELSSTYNRFGFGDGLRVLATSWLLFKASYELATRLPRPDETFGDGALGRANYGLKPEVSHNINVGPLFDLKLAGFGELTIDLNAFLRETRDQIVALGDDRTFMYRNVSDARSLGGEGAVKWEAPGRYVSISGSLTAQDQRNRSTEPPFDKYNGDRIPNRPWLFASWAAAVRGFELFTRGDSIELFYMARFTQWFYRGWASIGFKEWKDVVPSQLNHDLGLTYGWRMLGSSFHLTVELQNITNARLFDMFGVQRPGRAIFAKLSAQL